MIGPLDVIVPLAHYEASTAPAGRIPAIIKLCRSLEHPQWPTLYHPPVYTDPPHLPLTIKSQTRIAHGRGQPNLVCYDLVDALLLFFIQFKMRSRRVR